MTEWSLHDEWKQMLHDAENPDVFICKNRDYLRIAKNRFEWTGLEGTYLTSRDIENVFFNSEYVGVVQTNKNKPVVLPAIGLGVNFKNEPSSYDFDLKGTNNFTLDTKVYATGLGDNIEKEILTWLVKISDIQTSIDQQVFNTRAPILALVENEKQEKFTSNVIRKIGQGINALILKRGMLDEKIGALKLGGDYHGNELVAMKREYEREILTMLAVDTIQPLQKAERLISSEQESNDEVLACNMHDYQDRRNMLRDDMNDLFDLSTDVKPIKQKRVQDMIEDTSIEGGSDDSSTVN